jgi:hypothetical protein
MRKWCGLFLAGAFALCISAPSNADTLNYSATFSLELGSFPAFTANATGTTEATVAAGEVTAFTVPASVFKIAVNQDVDPDVVVTPGITLTAVKVTATNQKGVFDNAAGVGDGLMKFSGQSALLFQFFGKAKAGNLPLTGAIGTTDQVKATLFSLITLTLDAKKWTLGKGQLVTTPIGGGKKATITKTGDFSITGGGVNKFTYITPTQITIPGTANIASFGTLAIDITVPEAGNVLLLVTGAAVLLAIGYRRSAQA